MKKVRRPKKLSRFVYFNGEVPVELPYYCGKPEILVSVHSINRKYKYELTVDFVHMFEERTIPNEEACKVLVSVFDNFTYRKPLKDCWCFGPAVWIAYFTDLDYVVESANKIANITSDLYIKATDENRERINNYLKKLRDDIPEWKGYNIR